MRVRGIGGSSSRSVWALAAAALGAVACGDGGMITPGSCTDPCACADRRAPDYSRAGSGMATAGSSAEQREALERANRWRTGAGLPPFAAAPEIEQAASAHATFIATNPRSSCWSESSHREVMAAGCDGFTGVRVSDRLTTAGYRWTAAGEVIGWVNGPADAVDDWIWTVYHRQPFLDFSYVETGFGRARGPLSGFGDTFHNVMEFGRRRGTDPAEGPAYVVFPLPGQTDVPAGFRGDLEGPEPPAPMGASSWPSGYESGTVVSVHFRAEGFNVTQHQLFSRASGRCTELAHTFLSPMSDTNLSADQDVFMYADVKLAPSTEHVARVRGTLGDGTEFERIWAFTTAAGR